MATGIDASAAPPPGWSTPRLIYPTSERGPRRVAQEFNTYVHVQCLDANFCFEIPHVVFGQVMFRLAFVWLYVLKEV